ncbi:MAG: YitT family protein [Bacteroidales bacterium]|nr:YitT family protein [Bacteroidales bacterium]
MMKNITKTVIIKNIKSILLILLGVVSASFGLESFLIPNDFIDGGVTGISMLLAHTTGLPLYLWIIVINIPFIIWGGLKINIRFAVLSIIAISLLATSIAFVHFPIITSDTLLIAIFGGFFLGLGIGFAVRGSSVIDGTEVLALSISQKSFLSVGDTILILNVFIFSFAAYILGIETALYSLLTYFVASKTVDFVIHGIEEYYGLTIVSDKHQQIKLLLTDELNKSVTLYHARGGRAKCDDDDIEVVYVIVTRLEVNRVIRKVLEVDNKAFVAEHILGEVHGGIVKKKPLH